MTDYDFTQPVRIATRESQLALWQAEHVRDRLLSTFPALTVEIVKMTTKGDQLLDSPLAKIGGKGLFIKELEVSMLNGESDIAVHSMKDVPAEFPVSFMLAGILDREAPFDALVSNTYASIEALPQGAVVGTCSLRRSCQLLSHRPDLQIKNLRGNVNTRLAKLDAGEYDAIILAQAGLLRLGMVDRIAQVIPDSYSLPAVGQGAIGIECLEGSPVLSLVQALTDEATTLRVTAERAMNAKLEGGCQVPIAGFATFADDQPTQAFPERTLTLRGLVGSLDGQQIIRAEASGRGAEAEAIGLQVAESLLAQGARKLLDSIMADA